MTTDDIEMLADTTRKVLIQETAQAVLPRLRELGWFALRDESRPAAEGTFFDLQGECLATSAVFDVVIGEALGLDMDGVGFLHPLPGRNSVATPAVDERFLSVDGVLARPTDAARIVFVAGSGGGASVMETELRGLQSLPVDGLDPSLGWTRVRGVVDRGQPVTQEPALVDAATAAARRALAHELIGVTRAMMGTAIEHVRVRRQFGRPVGSFQSLQRRLAEAKVAQEAAEQAAEAAWTATDEPLAAMMAKVLAGTAARAAVKHCQQALGGMGFTWEHPFQRHMRRSLVLEAWYGTTAELTTMLGARVMQEGRAPRLVAL